MHSPDSWAGALGLYQNALMAARRSPGTIRLHLFYLSLLRERHPFPWSVRTVNLQSLMADREWGPESMKSARTVYRGFYRWGHGSGYVEVDPAFLLAAVKVPGGVPRPTPEHVVRQLLRDPDDRLGNLAMLAALGGLRCAEMAQVWPSRDYEGDRIGGRLIVQGKGGKVREVPIVDGRLATLLSSAPPGWLFPNGLGSHLSAGHVSRIMSAALPGRWTAHTLRHRCATVAYAGTRDLLAVGAMLGHSRPETTQRYVRTPDDAVRAAALAAAEVA